MSEKVILTSLSLGKQIKKALVDAGEDSRGRWTQTRLAEELHINKNVLNQFLGGRGGLPDYSVVAIARKLNATFTIDRDGVDYIINEEGLNKY